MDIHLQLGGDLFVWDAAKAEKNWHKHGVRFEEAATVFADPLFMFWCMPLATMRPVTRQSVST